MVNFIRNFSMQGIFSQLKEQWRDNPRRLLHKSLLVFLAADFILSPEPLWADVFYIVVLPLIIRTAWHGLASQRNFGSKISLHGTHRQSLWACIVQYWRSLPQTTQIGSVITFWVAVSLLWDTNVHQNSMLIGAWICNVLFTLTFILSLSDALCHGERFRDRLVTVLIWAGLANLTIVAARLPFLFDTFWSGDLLRITGWGATRHQIIGAIIVGLIVLFSANRLCCRLPGTRFMDISATIGVSGKTPPWVYALVGTMGLLFILMTGSRGPEISIAIALPILLIWINPRIGLLFIGSIVGSVAILTVSHFTILEHFWQVSAARGDSSRLAIWRMSWEAIKQRPLLGYGPTYLLPRIHNESFPHNLFLSTWIYTGVVGLALLMACMFSAVHHAWRATSSHRPLAIICLLYITLCGMTDLSQVARGPSLIWYIFWLPVLFAASSPLPTEKCLKNCD